MSSDKVQMFLKQNDSIYSSLVARNIKFDRVDLTLITDVENQLNALIDENNKLKEVVKANKPPQQQKEKKVIVPTINIEKPKTVKKDDDDEETFEDVKVNFPTITNMEEIKRVFCNNDELNFELLLQAHNFKYFSAKYKYESEKDGVQEFIAKNLVRGFVQSLDDYRKYLFVKFTCLLTDSENKIYSYPSLWIVNSTEPLENIIGTLYEDFEFVEVSNEDINDFYVNFRKTDFDKENNIINELYVH